MPRLFWRFFAIVWLTFATIVALIVVMVNTFQTAPFARELEERQRLMVLNLSATFLKREGWDAAQRFVSISEATTPMGLKIVKQEKDGCTDTAEADARTVAVAGACYRITLAPLADEYLKRLAFLMPWFAIFISSTISAAMLARYLIRPVVHLRNGLSALAHGRFDVRIGDKMAGRRDEVTALAHDFDASAARLQELQEAQQRLFHDVSHELRSPLSRLQAVVGVLERNPTRLGQVLERIDREVQRLDTLVGEILTLSRLTVGLSTPLNTQAVDIIELLNEILNDAAFEAQARNVSITGNVEGAFLAEVEGELIYRAIENVIRNAIKYTSENSHVTVACQSTPDMLELSVADQGPGVRRGELERIFQPFSRGSEAGTKGGYGLGLAIARQAVERHGGQVHAQLPDMGGLKITLVIPRKPALFMPVTGRG